MMTQSCASIWLRMLGQLGIHADWVDSGIQTVEMIKTAKQNGEMYDAVLLDWKMPDLDGFETTRRIRELCGGQLPVLIISAYDWSDVEKMQKGGCHRFSAETDIRLDPDSWAAAVCA